jgi:uncharacterized protein YcnI
VTRLLTVLALCSALALGTTAPVRAHVVVFPDDLFSKAPACGFTSFVVRVPTEKPIPTTMVRLQLPPTVTVIAARAKPGWHADFETEKGRITAITWSGGKIMPREYDEFGFLAAAPKKPGPVNWDALQTYDDGSVVKWTGKPGTDNPHSQTVFTAPAGPCSRRSL